ncbi:unnamed protein product [Pleuronectes platessa]|uniref:Uncharacterized protein n=1 Tax=Pleuronectes platessa TaxID=8262 RepID=A0A9N7VK17_PLEPL|nr:unnamed protein product [Pleuronectes platessa]
MRVDIPKDNPNMTCQAVPLQAQSNTATPGARSTKRNPWCGHRGPGSAGDKAKGFRGRGIGMEKRKEKLEREAPCVMCHKIEQDTCCGILDKL